MTIWKLATLALLLFSIVADSHSYHYYYIDTGAKGQYFTFGLCYIHQLWSGIFRNSFKPRCSSLRYYHEEQTDGELKWCSTENGHPVPYTLERVGHFPYDCRRIRDCAEGTVIETTNRCETRCSDGRDGYLFFCRNVCICPRGRFRNKDGKCVPKEDCEPIHKCARPKVYSACGSRCPATCKKPERVSYCKEGCEENLHCVCPDNMVQVSQKNDTCVAPSDCVCEKGAFYTDCAPKCPMLCPSLVPDNCVETEGCKEGVHCMCVPGTLQLDRTNVKCVPKKECPSPCEAPKVFDFCSTSCPPTCDDPEPDCELDRVKRICVRSCVCAKGYVLLDKDSDTCVKLSECPVKCDSPKIYTDCATMCPPTCTEPDPQVCSRACNAKIVCVCPPGMVQPDADTQTCILPSDCPEKCDAPKVFKKCPTKCPRTCVNHETTCEAGCAEERCVCPEGLVLISMKVRTCVKPSQCEAFSCDAPKIYHPCPTTCPETCDKPKAFLCTMDCSPDTCICPDGMVYMSETNRKCVRKSDCPPLCDAPKIYKQCGTTCPPTCDNPEPQHCTRDCSREKCHCPEGLVLLSMKDRKCIKKSQCPVKCKKPKIPVDCATYCPPTCDHPNPEVCSRACNPRVLCVCPHGLVQRSKTDTTCIKESECPKCPSPKVFVECASKCRPTCATPNPTLCDSSCDPDIHCVCPPGMVHPKNADLSCINLDDCPVSCEYPMIYTACVPKCPRTCDDPLPTCGDGCMKDLKCMCPFGLLQLNSANKTCVFPTQCPNLTKDCPIRKIPTRCATGCPATCANPNPRFCTLDCRPEVNCVCSPGMVQRSLEDDTCVWPKDC